MTGKLDEVLHRPGHARRPEPVVGTKPSRADRREFVDPLLPIGWG